MDKITSIVQLQELILYVRNMRQGFVTNFYLDEAKHGAWIETEQFLYDKFDDMVLLLFDHEDPRSANYFTNLFYVSTSIDAVIKHLKVYRETYDYDWYVMDIVERKVESGELRVKSATEQFLEMGAHHEATLVRMNRVSVSQKLPTIDQKFSLEENQKNIKKIEESSDIGNISTSLDQQSANEQDSLLTSAQFCSTDIVSQSLSDDSSTKNKKNISAEAIQYAEERDVEKIDKILHANFDEKLEQLPLVSELKQMIADKRILKCVIDGQIAGILLFELNASTLYLRYWLTLSEYRNNGVGGALLKRFFYEGRDTKRQILWVREDNANAIMRYEHYGFAKENMLDNILFY